MVIRLLNILIVLLLLITKTHSQSHFTGIKVGVWNDQFLNGKNLAQNSLLFVGANYEYVSKFSFMSVSTEINFVFETDILLLPLLFNFRIGDKFKLIASGGAVPVIRFKKMDPNKTFTIGAYSKLGFNYSLNKSFSIHSDFGLVFVPSYEFRPSNYASNYVVRTVDVFQFISIGCNYSLGRK